MYCLPPPFPKENVAFFYPLPSFKYKAAFLLPFPLMFLFIQRENHAQECIMPIPDLTHEQTQAYPQKEKKVERVGETNPLQSSPHPMLGHDVQVPACFRRNWRLISSSLLSLCRLKLDKGDKTSTSFSWLFRCFGAAVLRLQSLLSFLGWSLVPFVSPSVSQRLYFTMREKSPFLQQ